MRAFRKEIRKRLDAGKGDVGDQFERRQVRA